jgi:glyoxylase-like metal-dependent hydrolase (beta-lactamase superfamily II)
VASQKLADGVWFLKGVSHNSLVLDFNEYIVVIEGPVNAAQAEAVIAEAHRLVPSKPIRYLINTHHHFDHLGGVRTFAGEGVTIVTTSAAQGYIEMALRAPRTLNPDKLSTSGRKPAVEGVSSKRVLTDGTHTIELYSLVYQPHVDALLFAYLPKDKILVQADITVVAAPDAANTAPNPLSVKFHDDIQRLKLDVKQIVGIHGGVTSVEQLDRLVAVR